MRKHELNIIFAVAGNSIGLGALIFGAPAIMWGMPLIGSTLALLDICAKEAKTMRRGRSDCVNARLERLKF